MGLKKIFSDELKRIKKDFKDTNTGIQDDFKEIKDIIKEHKEENEKINTKGLPKVDIDILNGKEQLGYEKGLFQIVQLQPGEIRLRVSGTWSDKEYYFIKYERTENIKKSALDIAGWTFAGNMLWGNAGALAGGLAAQKGTDKSTAALFLVEKDTDRKIMLIIKCDSKVLEKLSLFIPSEKKFDSQEIKPESDKYDQLEKIAVLKEKGILSEEEFQQEKDKILNQ